MNDSYFAAISTGHFCCICTDRDEYRTFNVLYYYFAKLHIGIGWKKLPQREFEEFIRLAATLLVTILVEQLFYQTNQIVLGASSGTDAVAVYSVATLIYLNYRGLAGVITDIFSPHISTLVAKQGTKDEITETYLYV